MKKQGLWCHGKADFKKENLWITRKEKDYNA